MLQFDSRGLFSFKVKEYEGFFRVMIDILPTPYINPKVYKRDIPKGDIIDKDEIFINNIFKNRMAEIMNDVGDLLMKEFKSNDMKNVINSIKE